MMTSHCIPCIYRRYLGGGEYYCAYYLDTGKKLPCPGGDGCTARLILPPAKREAYLREHREPPMPARPTRDMIGDDFVWDSRGIMDRWYNKT